MIQAPPIDTFIRHFEERDRSTLPGWLAATQEDAFQSFTASGLPTVKQEAWRQTDITPISRLPLTTVAAGSEPGCVELPMAGLDGHQVLVVNGRVESGLGDVGGITVKSLANEGGQPGYGTVVDYAENAFAALNTAMCADGVAVRAGAEATADKPIHIVHVVTTSNLAHYPRTLIVAGHNAELTVIESFVGADDLRYFTNSVTEIVAGEGAAVTHVRLQKESTEAFHIGSVDINIEAGGNVATYAINVGGKLSRTNVAARLDGEDAECTLNGMYLVGGTQVTDTHTFIDHAVANCRSNELYKGVLDDTARGSFTGKILVRKDAQKTDSEQTNRSLLLNDGARVNAQPQLEIYADDVKCTHGATIGELDETAVFYLRSRGISEAEARRMLMQTFVVEAVAEIEIPAVQDEIRKILKEKFDKK
jgi:Fe-S cluster assembly protein SufD